MTELAKLKIAKITDKADRANPAVSTDPAEVFECQFNPESFKISKTNLWFEPKTTGKNTTEPTFGGGKGQSMQITLKFDSSSDGTSVIDKYAVLIKLSKVDTVTVDGTTSLGEPPWVMVKWGGYIGFAAVITGLNVDYTFFKKDGTPIRATVDVMLRQVTDDQSMAAQNPTSRSEARRTWIVEQGQRLDWIAHKEYGDSSRWRTIADANGLNNPFDLRSGQILVIPTPVGKTGRRA